MSIWGWKVTSISALGHYWAEREWMRTRGRASSWKNIGLINDYRWIYYLNKIVIRWILGHFIIYYLEVDVDIRLIRLLPSQRLHLVHCILPQWWLLLCRRSWLNSLCMVIHFWFRNAAFEPVDKTVILQKEGHSLGITDIKFSNRGSNIAVCSMDSLIRNWDIDTSTVEYIQMDASR